MSVIDDCLVDLPDRINDLCAEDKIAGISAMAIINPLFTFIDPSDPTEWTAGIASGDIVIIRDGNGTYPDAAPIFTDNGRANGPTQKLTGLDHTFTFIDPNVFDVNDEFWSIANGKTFHFGWYNFEEKEVRLVEDYNSQVVALPANDDRSVGYQRYMVTVTWRTKPEGYPSRNVAPAGIFE